MPMQFAYTQSHENELLLAAIEEFNQLYRDVLANDPGLAEAVGKKLKIIWTADSNALEGSTLSRADTFFFLQEGLTVEGKPLKDFLDARNHAEAIDYLMEFITSQRPLTTGFLKEINALLLHGVESTPAIDMFGRRMRRTARPGQYKLQPNHVVQPDGSIHQYVDPLQVEGEMEELVEWINDQQGRRNPVIIAAIAHYNMVRIHPFDDGNGRGARILMNLILMKAGYLPATIRSERRRAYLDAIREADKGLLDEFIAFITGELAETMLLVEKELDIRENKQGLLQALDKWKKSRGGLG